MKATRSGKWSRESAVRLHRKSVDSRLGLRYIQQHRFGHIIRVLILANAVSVILFLLRLIGADNFRYWFMLWNLTLAWIAPLVALVLVIRLRTLPWKHWSNVMLSALWLGFLPNSFYMVSDLMHVQQTGEINIIFDAVLFTSFVLNGLIAGYLSTYMIHRELLRRVSMKASYLLIGAVFVLSSYAIYIGRVLRWNTWDALLQPAAVLFDISDSIINPFAHPQAWVITGSYTLLIGIFYLLAFELLRALRSTNR